MGGDNWYPAIIGSEAVTKENINDVNLGYITIGKTELSALTGCRRVAYAISVHTQPLGMLAVI